WVQVSRCPSVVGVIPDVNSADQILPHASCAVTAAMTRTFDQLIQRPFGPICLTRTNARMPPTESVVLARPNRSPTSLPRSGLASHDADWLGSGALPPNWWSAWWLP